MADDPSDGLPVGEAPDLTEEEREALRKTREAFKR